MVTRNHIAALDASGQVTDWNPNANDTVSALMVQGSTVYAGGYFITIGSQAVQPTRNWLAALNVSDGLATSWNANMTTTLASGYVKAITLSPGANTIYICGSFTSATGQGRRDVAEINLSDGSPTGWNPNPSGTASYVTKAVASGSIVYVGGNFTTIGGQSRSNLAAINASDGLATVWSPNPNNTVQDVEVVGNTVCAGGYFTAIGAQAPQPARNFVATQASATWYLPEGSTAWGFDCYIAIGNPNSRAVTVSVTYMTTKGPVSRPDLFLPAFLRSTLNPRDDIGDQDFSTRIVCRDKRLITADRTMTWTGPGAESDEKHCSTGVACGSDTWYMPEGCSSFGFETWLLIQNPNDRAANCTVTYMTEGKGPKVVEKVVAPNSRATFNMEQDIGQENASIMINSDIPVITERAQYRNNRREGHDSIGTTRPAKDYYLAEGTTAWGYTQWLLIQNPNNAEADVTVTYMTSSGPKEQPPFKMMANFRKTIRVNDVIPNEDLSTQVHSNADTPIIAERAMYWDNTTGEACHDTIGFARPHSNFYLADGRADDDYETWTLVQNPNSDPVDVGVYYLLEGVGFRCFKDTVIAGGRTTYRMSDTYRGKATVLVQTLNTNRPVMVERAMYSSNWGAGTVTTGGYSD